MQKILFPLVAGLVFAPAVHADDAIDAKAIIEKAIQARGKSASKDTSMTWKETGKFLALSTPLQMNAEWAFQAPDKCRFTFTLNFGDSKLNGSTIVNGPKAWEVEGKKVEELTGEKLTQTRNEAYLLWVSSLTPLVNEKGLTLTTPKGKNVNDKPTNAIKVTRDKMPAITLYFDKETGLLVKREVMVKDEYQNWKEVLDEAFFSDYKDINGTKFFTKLKIVRGGKTILESTLTDQKLAEKLDAKLFEK